jgi:hypothetical protein
MSYCYPSEGVLVEPSISGALHLKEEYAKVRFTEMQECLVYF